MLAREGLPDGGDPAASSAPCARPAASQDDVRDLDLRLTEIEFRMRLLDGASPEAWLRPPLRTAPRSAAGPASASASVSCPRRPAGPATRAALRWRRARREPEAYD